MEQTRSQSEQQLLHQVKSLQEQVQKLDSQVKLQFQYLKKV